ncbi:catalase [Pseudanabaena sp. PCC 6802]|uniref:catalase n=1 Tax=Pseudanabaena sp. PCC 6802 TaxID=118173 RepID=UPI00034D7645|nr:catalase [Pseudanabaena sp. PCC 6802]
MSDRQISEEEATKLVLDRSLKAQEEKGPDLRQLHAKSHGLVYGKFIINDNIPDRMKVGVFAGKEYPIWVRFSNSAPPKERGVLEPDTNPAGRGMAIKLMSVAGKKIMDDEERTQDFVLLNFPRFFVRDAQEYLIVFSAEAGIMPTSPELQEVVVRAKQIREEIGARKVENPLRIQYWSTTPYQLGSQTIKFAVQPEDVESPPNSIEGSDANYLRAAIRKYLTEDAKTTKFKFLIQPYIDDNLTPIEDPTKEWNSEPIEVATIVIPPQSFDFDERKRLDESLSFTPWHSLYEHEPVGKVNLSRKEIYHQIAQHRRQFIEKRLREPQPYEAIKDDPKT